uniref:Uncharacterized protein n=3 Tax=Rhodnius prolixus TaxID=13249 RepID=T1HMM9_RHOPR
MWGLELPYRRYSVPETVMRKVRLRQNSSSSSDSSTRRAARRPIAKARQAGRSRYCMHTSNKGVQTSPNADHYSVGYLENKCLLHTWHQGPPRRASSVPDLSSDAEGRDGHRPSSARDKFLQRYSQPTCNGPPVIISPGGTPSPIQASNYSSALHRCDVYSNSWSYTSSECTLGQTVSDRTTSTQDSTLSLQSSTPESSNSNYFSPTERAAQKMFLENSIFSPAGNFIAVHTESLLIHPIEIIERRENWNFGFSDSPESDPLAALTSCHRSIAVNTEPPEMIGASMVDKSTCAYGVFNDKSAQVRDSDIENELMVDKSTTIEVNGFLRKGNGETNSREISVERLVEEPPFVDIGINTEQCIALLDDDKENENQFSEYPLTASLSRRAVFKIPNIKIFKGSTTESQQTDDRSNVMEEAKVYVAKSTSMEESYFGNIEDDVDSKQICKYCSKEETAEKYNIFDKEMKQLWQNRPERTDDRSPYESKLCANVACAGCNYKDYPEVKGVIARFSALPRSNSMLVNTSSIDYSSDSELSLTDSLEDCNEHTAEQYHRPVTRHDNRLVRGEVSLEQEQSSKKYPKSNKAYAYFLSISGEQDMVRQYPLPDWLKVRLQRREEEIKKLFQIRLNKHQTIVYRRRKKGVKKIIENEGSNSSPSKENKPKKLHQEQILEKAEETIEKDKSIVENVEAEKLPSTSAADSMNDQVGKKVVQDNVNTNSIAAQTTGEEMKSGRLELQQITNKDNNYLHISEVIKIEMLNNLNTVITKEKQINLNKHLLSRGHHNFQTSECIKNESPLNAHKIIMKTNIGNLQIDNNSLPELKDETDKTFNEKEKVTAEIKDKKEAEKKKEKALIKKDENESYSFKQFKPLFESKADDQTVAEILLSAMKNNASLKTADEDFKNKEKEPLGGLQADQIKTAELETTYTKEVSKLNPKNVAFSEPNIKEERSCNTINPYLSATVQTTESFLKDKCVSWMEKEEGEMEELKGIPSTTFITNESIPDFPMISSLVQTNETFLKNDKSFIESESLVPIRDQGTDVFQEFSEDKNANDGLDNALLCNIENEQSSVFVQTEQNIATINEVKPLIIHSNNEEFKRIVESDDLEDKRYTSTKKTGTNSCKIRRHGMDLHKQNCKYYPGGSQEHKPSQVLELNVQPCTCHMCTLNKKVGSRGDKLCEGPQSGFQSSSGSRKKLLNKSSPSEHKEEKKSYQRYSSNRRTNKFQRRFEVIPEEKNSSMESVGETQSTLFKVTHDKNNSCENENLDKAGLDQEDYAKVPVSEVQYNRETKELPCSLSMLQERENLHSSDVKSTQTNGSRKSNVVFGSFKAIKNEARTKEDKMLGEGIEVMQQYKGRAALAAAPVDAQEQLLTLSKGWINFYLLKDNQEFSDSNNDEVQKVYSGSLVQRAVSPIRILKGSEIKEEQVEEFTVEIRATPEPIQSSEKTVLLPNLHQDILRKRRTVKPQPPNSAVSLPEIHTSSSSSTPENVGDRIVSVEDKRKKCHPLPVVSGRSSRHEIKMKRESLTAFKKIPKSEPLLRLAEEFASGFEKGHSAKAVEVALSEHSVSSISSTLILSEDSPSPKLERKSRQRRGQIMQQQSDQNGSSWTVTVAGTSGSNSNVHPDVEMKLTFGNKQNGNNNKELCDENEKRLVKYNGKKSSHIRSSKRRGRLTEEYAHTTRNEKRSIQYMPNMVIHNSQQSKIEGALSQKDLVGYLDHENTSQLSRRSKGSMEGSSDAASLCSDLQVTGLAITPESKPYVPTQSERDLVRRQ